MTQIYVPNLTFAYSIWDPHSKCLHDRISPLMIDELYKSIPGPDPDLKSDRCIIDYKTTNLSGVGAKSG